MTVYRFNELKQTARKSGSCTVCGKRRTRQATFMQTLNPFNKTADGVVKSAGMIHEELRVEADAWRAEPLVCASCEAVQS